MAISDIQALAQMPNGETPWGDEMRGAMTAILSRLDRSVLQTAATGTISIDWAAGNSHRINAAGNIGPFVALNATYDRVGQLYIVNTTGTAITINWTGLQVSGTPPTSLPAGQVIWASLGVII